MKRRNFYIGIVVILTVLTILFLLDDEGDFEPDLISANKENTGGRTQAMRNGNRDEFAETNGASVELDGAQDIRGDATLLEWWDCTASFPMGDLVSCSTVSGEEWQSSSAMAIADLEPPRVVAIRQKRGQIILLNSKQAGNCPQLRTGRITIAPRDALLSDGGWQLKLASKDLNSIDGSGSAVEKLMRAEFRTSGFGQITFKAMKVAKPVLAAGAHALSSDISLSMMPGAYSIYDATLPVGWRLREHAITWTNTIDQEVVLHGERTPTASVTAPKNAYGAPISPLKITCFWERLRDTGEVSGTGEEDVRFKMLSSSLIMSLDFEDPSSTTTLYTLRVVLQSGTHVVANRCRFQNLKSAIESYQWN